MRGGALINNVKYDLKSYNNNKENQYKQLGLNVYHEY